MLEVNWGGGQWSRQEPTCIGQCRCLLRRNKPRMFHRITQNWPRRGAGTCETTIWARRESHSHHYFTAYRNVETNTGTLVQERQLHVCTTLLVRNQCFNPQEDDPTSFLPSKSPGEWIQWTETNSHNNRNLPARRSEKYSFHLSNPSYYKQFKRNSSGPIQTTQCSTPWEKGLIIGLLLQRTLLPHYNSNGQVKHFIPFTSPHLPLPPLESGEAVEYSWEW